MSIFSKSEPFRMSGITALCPNGSIDHADFGVTFKLTFSQVWPSVSCCNMLSQCVLASSVMTQPPVTNSNWRRFNNLFGQKIFFQKKELLIFFSIHTFSHRLFHPMTDLRTTLKSMKFPPK